MTIGSRNTHIKHILFSELARFIPCETVLCFWRNSWRCEIWASQIMTLSMLAIHWLAAHCLRSPSATLELRFLAGWFEGLTYHFERVFLCMLCLYTIALAFVWPVESHEASHNVLFLMWFGCHGWYFDHVSYK